MKRHMVQVNLISVQEHRGFKITGVEIAGSLTMPQKHKKQFLKYTKGSLSTVIIPTAKCNIITTNTITADIKYPQNVLHALFTLRLIYIILCRTSIVS